MSIERPYCRLGTGGGYRHVFSYRDQVAACEDVSHRSRAGSMPEGLRNQAIGGTREARPIGSSAQQSTLSGMLHNGGRSEEPWRRDQKASLRVDSEVNELLAPYSDSEPPTGLDHPEAVEAGLGGLVQDLNEALDAASEGRR